MFMESALRSREQESKFIDVVSDVSKEIQLGPLLQKIMTSVTALLNAERSTLFLNDAKASQLYTEIGQGLGTARIAFSRSDSQRDPGGAPDRTLLHDASAADRRDREPPSQESGQGPHRP